MNVSVKEFGKLPNGKKVNNYILENDNGYSAVISEYGGLIVNLMVPDKNGKAEDIALGRETLEDYTVNPGYLGAVIGRNSNRILDAKVFLDGEEFLLEKNDGDNNLHSGSGCLAFRLFSAAGYVTDDEAGVELNCLIEDMEDGFPGNLHVNVHYRLTNSNKLVVEYNAVSDRETIINLTQHNYFNLAGHSSGSIDNHILQLEAPFFTPNGHNCIPTGEILKTEGTPFDFAAPKKLSEAIYSDFEQVKMFNGIDHNFILSGEGERRIATLSHEESGRIMHVYTDLPAVQVYTGNGLNNINGKGGAVYKAHGGICLETQGIPNATQMPWVSSVVYAAGEEFSSVTEFCFEVKK